jgi:hypothetical protein
MRVFGFGVDRFYRQYPINQFPSLETVIHRWIMPRMMTGNTMATCIIIGRVDAKATCFVKGRLLATI